MKIVEIFKSIQGEGIHTGRPSVFIRTYGCNLNCSWCDTEYALILANYTEMQTVQIMAEVNKIMPPPGLVVITGGEPMIHWDNQLSWLVGLLQTEGYETHIETNGTVMPVDTLKYVDFLSISPKLNHDLDKVYGPAKLSYFESVEVLCNSGIPCQLKFVIQEPHDVIAVGVFMDTLKIPATIPIVLQPERFTFEGFMELPMMSHSTVSNQPEALGYTTTYDPDTHSWTTTVVPRIAYLDNLSLLMEWAEEYLQGYNYRILPQLHYLMWGGRRGV